MIENYFFDSISVNLIVKVISIYKMVLEGEEFFKTLKTYSGLTIKNDLQFILSDCGFDNAVAFVKINRSTFEEMKIYMAEKKKKSFLISPGDKEIILQLVRYVRKYYDDFSIPSIFVEE